MEIVGLTDCFEGDHLKEMSLEELLDLQHRAEEKHAEIQMQLEALQQAGGVSREYASGMSEYLPAEMVLESFTSQVTRTNYELACESLSTAAKIAIGVAVVAGLGALLFYANRAAGREVEQVNKERADKAEEYAKVRAENRAKNAQAFKELEEKEERIEKARTAAVEKMVEEMPTNAVLGHLVRAAKGDTIKLGSYLISGMNTLELQLESDYKTYLIPAIDAAEEFSRTGREDALRKVNNLDLERPLKDVTRWSNVLGSTLTLSIRDLGGKIVVEDSTLEGCLRALTDWGNKKDLLTTQEAKRIFTVLSTRKVEFEIVNFKHLMSAVADVVKLSKDLPLQEKRIGALTNVPKEVTELLKGYIEVTKTKLHIVEALQGIINFEIKAFNQVATFVGKSAADDLRREIAVLEGIISEQDASPKIQAVAQKLREELKKGLPR